MTVVRAHGGTPIKIVAVVDRAPTSADRFDVPFETVIDIDVETYTPEACPLCAQGVAAIKPGSRGVA
jgi:orotate phosphoribosyltransferase